MVICPTRCRNESDASVRSTHRRDALFSGAVNAVTPASGAGPGTGRAGTVHEQRVMVPATTRSR